jgi:hypothetical protein
VRREYRDRGVRGAQPAQQWMVPVNWRDMKQAAPTCSLCCLKQKESES